MKDTKLHELLEAHGVNLTKIVAWSRGYNPFQLGPCHYLFGARLNCEKPVHLGKGFYGCLAKGPDGMTKVVEPVSGAVIGTTIKECKADIRACKNIKLMQGQIEKAIQEKEKKGLRIVTPEEFWEKMKRAKE